VVGVLRNRQRLTDLISTFAPSGFGTRRVAYVWAARLDVEAAGGFREMGDLFGGGSTPMLPAGATGAATIRLAQPLDADRVRAAVEAEGLRVLYAGDVLRRMRWIFGMADGILFGLGTVALLVAALGIVNTMLMAVLERTREIGVLKALGARDRTIAWLFWCEAGWLGAVGGVAGCALGWTLGEIASVAVNHYYVVPQAGEAEVVDLYAFPVWLGAVALGLAMAIAWLAALYPARRAARIDPVRALRYD
jgi:putative ABC transport system permease protein